MHGGQELCSASKGHTERGGLKIKFQKNSSYVIKKRLVKKKKLLLGSFYDSSGTCSSVLCLIQQYEWTKWRIF